MRFPRMLSDSPRSATGYAASQRGADRLWKSSDLALAIDPTTLCAIVASVVYRGCAIPVARVAMPANKPVNRIDPAIELLEPLACRHSHEYEGNRDGGSRTEKSESVEKDTLARMASVHAPAHSRRIPPCRMDENIRPQSCCWSEQRLQRARDSVHCVLETVSVDDNRNPGGTVDHADRPRADGGGDIVALVPLPDRNGIQCAQERGLSAAEKRGGLTQPGWSATVRLCRQRRCRRSPLATESRTLRR